jgi:hypothetical protein
LRARLRTRLRRALAWLLLALPLASAAAAQPASQVLEQAPPSFREWVESLPESQQRPILRRLANMPAQRRSTIFRRWDALEEGERRKLQAFLEERADARERGEPPLSREERQRRLEELSPESREKLAPLVRRWRGMEPGERRRMRERLERFRMLAPDEQEALIERRFSGKSPEERARILEALRDASRALPERPLVEEPPAPIAPAPTTGD